MESDTFIAWGNEKVADLGGTCEEPAGKRGGGFYAGYFVIWMLISAIYFT